MSFRKPVTILMADDDPDDRLLTREAFEESHFPVNLYFAEDGDQLMNFLQKKEGFENVPTPDLILLDLKMPRKNGIEVLREIKNNPDWQNIPVVVITTSRDEEDVQETLKMGANSFIVKPIKFSSLVDYCEKILSKI